MVSSLMRMRAEARLSFFIVADAPGSTAMNLATPRRVSMFSGLVPGALRRKAAMLYTPVAPAASNAAGSLMRAAAFCGRDVHT